MVHFVLIRLLMQNSTKFPSKEDVQRNPFSTASFSHPLHTGTHLFGGIPTEAWSCRCGVRAVRPSVTRAGAISSCSSLVAVSVCRGASHLGTHGTKGFLTQLTLQLFQTLFLIRTLKKKKKRRKKPHHYFFTDVILLTSFINILCFWTSVILTNGNTKPLHFQSCFEGERHSVP